MSVYTYKYFYSHTRIYIYIHSISIAFSSSRWFKEIQKDSKTNAAQPPMAGSLATCSPRASSCNLPGLCQPNFVQWVQARQAATFLSMPGGSLSDENRAKTGVGAIHEVPRFKPRKMHHGHGRRNQEPQGTTRNWGASKLPPHNSSRACWAFGLPDFRSWVGS